MEIGLAGALIIKCLDCGAEYRIDIDSLDEECFAYERNMGDEVEHDFYGEYKCKGCEILESLETVVNYYNSDFDYYEEEG